MLAVLPTPSAARALYAVLKSRRCSSCHGPVRSRRHRGREEQWLRRGNNNPSGGRDGPSICERGWSGGCVDPASCESGWSDGCTDVLMEVPVCTLILTLGGSWLYPGLKGVHPLGGVLWSQDDALIQVAGISINLVRKLGSRHWSSTSPSEQMMHRGTLEEEVGDGKQGRGRRRGLLKGLEEDVAVGLGGGCTRGRHGHCIQTISA